MGQGIPAAVRANRIEELASESQSSGARRPSGGATLERDDPASNAGAPPHAGRVSSHLLLLTWGILLLAVWMALGASGLVETFEPTPHFEGAEWVETWAAEWTVLGAWALLILSCLFLGLGLRGLQADNTEVRDRLSWRWGPLAFGPLRLIALLGLLTLLAAVAAVEGLTGGGLSPGYLFLAAAFEGFLVATGWCLMVFPARALAPWAGGVEARALAGARFLITVAAALDVAAWVLAAAVGSFWLATHVGAYALPYNPWAEGSLDRLFDLTAVAGLLVVAWAARRIVHRVGPAPLDLHRGPA